MNVNARLASIENSLKQYLNIHGLSIYTNEIVGIINSTKTSIEENSLKIKPFASILNFPSVGDNKTIYIDTTNKRIYLWDEKYLKYYCFGSDYHNIEVINGGSSK